MQIGSTKTISKSYQNIIFFYQKRFTLKITLRTRKAREIKKSCKFHT